MPTLDLPYFFLLEFLSEFSIWYTYIYTYNYTLWQTWFFKELYFPGGSDGKKSAYKAADQVQSLGQEDPLKKGMATHCSTLAWRILGTEESGGPQSMGS